MGYYDCITPPVIQRNILETPGWYTQYTPYQAEIAQGRLEALLNFQTMVADLTGLPLANASLLDEATAAAEAMTMCRAITRSRATVFFVADDCHPQTIAVVRTREPSALGIEVASAANRSSSTIPESVRCSAAVPNDRRTRSTTTPSSPTRPTTPGALVVVATDLLALTLLRPPGEFGADIAIGSSQRFGVPMGYGGPHAAFLPRARSTSGRFPAASSGVSKDDRGKPGAAAGPADPRAAHPPRQGDQQHLHRAGAAGDHGRMYGVYHGPRACGASPERVHGMTQLVLAGLRRLGW